jgi:hypothetical protein
MRKYELNGFITVTFCVIFQFLTMFNTIVRAGAVGAGAGAALRYGSGSISNQKMRLRLRNTDRHITKKTTDSSYIYYDCRGATVGDRGSMAWMPAYIAASNLHIMIWMAWTLIEL